MGMLVGKPVKRIEDPKLITGGECYVADIKLPRMLYMHVVRSPHPTPSSNTLGYRTICPKM
jgi:carbon-monoxide dehydrogenase large subunit